MMHIYHLPVPPSANNLFINMPGTGRIKSSKYRKWLVEAGHKLNVQRPRPVVGPAKVEIIAARPNASRDLDNIIKPTLDLLVRHGVLKDDRNVLAIAAEWSSADLTGMSVSVQPLERPNEESTQGGIRDTPGS